MIGVGFAVFCLALLVALLWMELRNVRARVEQLANQRAASTPAIVTAAIEDLRTALAQVSSTNRREFGAIWKRLGIARRLQLEQQTEEEAPTQPAANDDRFEAMLALQSTPPAKP